MKEILLNMLKEKIKTWNKSDIYAISLWVNDNDDNPCEPTVTLGYNTESHYQTQIEKASDAEEARWNFAFWLQNEELIFGIDESQQIVKKWILENGFQYFTNDELITFEQIDEAEKITGVFVNVLVDIVKELHVSGFIKEQFGREIPILIHELEYYEEIANQNIEANGIELVKKFTKFCMYG